MLPFRQEKQKEINVYIGCKLSFILYSLHTHSLYFSVSPPFPPKGLFSLSPSVSWSLSCLTLLSPPCSISPLTGWICTCGYVRASSQPSSCSSRTMSYSHRERQQSHHPQPSLQHNIKDGAYDLPCWCTYVILNYIHHFGTMTGLQYTQGKLGRRTLHFTSFMDEIKKITY